jgi:hypothetical protein
MNRLKIFLLMQIRGKSRRKVKKKNKTQCFGEAMRSEVSCTMAGIDREEQIPDSELFSQTRLVVGHNPRMHQPTHSESAKSLRRLCGLL